MWEFQNIIVYLMNACGVVLLVKKFFFRKKKLNSAGCEKSATVII